MCVHLTFTNNKPGRYWGTLLRLGQAGQVWRWTISERRGASGSPAATCISGLYYATQRSRTVLRAAACALVLFCFTMSSVYGVACSAHCIQDSFGQARPNRRSRLSYPLIEYLRVYAYNANAWRARVQSVRVSTSYTRHNNRKLYT